MREQPNQKALLDIARQVLKESIIPHLPKDQIYNGLMVANAIAIASRQYGNEAIAKEKQMLQGLHLSLVDTDSTDSRDQVAQATKKLSIAIRQGEFDEPAKQRALGDYLSYQVLQRIKESNPKMMP